MPPAVGNALPTPRISEVGITGTQRRLVLMSCPGVRFGPKYTHAKAAFLAQDVDRLQALGVRLVLSCLQKHELELGVECYEDAYRRRGIFWEIVPIADMSAPRPDQEILLDRAFSVVDEVLSKGGGVAIHCRAGLGRTGTVAARFAMNYGLKAPEAITLIRAKHDRRAIETREQEDYLLEHRFYELCS